MVRKCNILVYIRDYFIDNGTEAECKTCGKSLNAVHITNLKRHLQKSHAELMVEYEKRRRIESEKDENDKKIKFTVEMSPNEVNNACIDFLTKESQPLSFFDTKSFQTLTTPIFEGLKMPKINSKNVMDLVNSKFEKLKMIITKAVEGKVLSLKIDTATRSDRSILGINVQLLLKREIKILTLSMLELKKGILLKI